MKQIEISRALGLSLSTIERNVAKGMPTDSIESAKAWRQARPKYIPGYPRVSITVNLRKWRAEHPLEAKKNIEAAQRVAIKKTRGAHGFGCQERGNLLHCCAKKWTIQSPDGVRYTFTNLSEWSRQNEHLFADDNYETYKSPFWYRIANGFWDMASSAKNRYQYRGWVLISIEDIPEDAAQ